MLIYSLFIKGSYPKLVAQERWKQMLDLQSGTPSTLAGHRFFELLGEDEMAFANLFCDAFKELDTQWLAKRASYMEFTYDLKILEDRYIEGSDQLYMGDRRLKS